MSSDAGDETSDTADIVWPTVYYSLLIIGLSFLCLIVMVATVPRSSRRQTKSIDGTATSPASKPSTDLPRHSKDIESLPTSPRSKLRSCQSQACFITFLTIIIYFLFQSMGAFAVKTFQTPPTTETRTSRNILQFLLLVCGIFSLITVSSLEDVWCQARDGAGSINPNCHPKQCARCAANRWMHWGIQIWIWTLFWPALRMIWLG